MDQRGREPEDQSKAQRKPPEPEQEPSCVSLKSNRSKDANTDFKSDQPSAANRKRPEPEPGPEPSCVSLKSNKSKDAFFEFKSDQRLPAKRKRPEPGPEPEPSCVSLKSDKSKDAFFEFKSDQRLPAKRLYQQSSEVPSGPSDQQHQTELDSIFMLLEENIVTFVKKELKKIQKVLSLEESLECQWEDEGEDEEQRKSSREALVKITMNFLRRMKQEGMADRLQSRTGAGNCQRKLKSNLKMKFQCVFEGIAKAGNPSLLNQIYTELYITEGGTGEVNEEHEVRQIERASRKPHRPETTIRQEDILKPSPERDQPIRAVMTKGVAGIGKTVLTQKFTLDWAEGKAHQNIQFIFPFTFRELNVLKEKKFSLVELVHRFFTETKEICNFEDFQVLFILDGLDESRLPLDFTNKEILTDVTESTSVDVLLINLIRGNLLPSALLWITTRPAAANQIPPQCVDRITEVRGFTDQQKEEYFRKRFRDEEKASKIISHIRTSRSLHIMCHIPVFCWVAAAVLEVLEVEKRGELPNTLTQMYIYFLVFQINMRKTKYDRASVADPHWSPESRKIIVSLAKLAFDQLQKRNAIFYESHLTECGIDVRAASVYSGVFTEIFKEETGLHQKKVFCFVHLSVQEFLAALHVHLTFINSGINLMEEQSTSWRSETREDESAETDIYRSAVDKALQSSDGHLDLFLRFFMGLSVQNNQRLLEGLLRQTPCCSNTNQETVQYVKKKISENLQAEKSINLFHCLNELNDRSLMEEIQRSLDSGSLSPERLSPAQWSALAFILTSSEQSLDTFDLKKYSASEDTFLRLLPVVKQSKKAILSHCNLSDRSCETLSSVLGSYSSSLTELNLSNNNLKDSGVFLLCSGLESQDCALEILRLSSCNLSGTSCKHLSSVLRSQSSRLTDLDLTNNDLSDSGVNLLSAGLESPHCKLQTLSLSGCLITEEGCAFLAAALSSNPSHLRDLDLSYNHPGEDGEKLMTARLEDGRSRLETLRMEPAGVQYLKQGLRKYSRRLVFDRNTMHRNLKLSEDNRKVTHVEEDQLYSDHPDRFDWCRQLLCRDALIGRCYWEVERKGRVHVSVSYRGIGRKGDSDLCELGYNEKSWSLFCSDGIYSVYHNNKGTSVSLNSISTSSSSSVTSRVAVYLDHPAGLLSFYRVSSDSLIHIHTFSTSFSEPLHPGFGVGFRPGSSVSLCLV